MNEFLKKTLKLNFVLILSIVLTGLFSSCTVPGGTRNIVATPTQPASPFQIPFLVSTLTPVPPTSTIPPTPTYPSMEGEGELFFQVGTYKYYGIKLAT